MGCAGRRPAQAVEVDVQGEIASAISMAFDSNWSLPFLEEQIKEHKGNVHAVFHEVGFCSVPAHMAMLQG